MRYILFLGLWMATQTILAGPIQVEGPRFRTKNGHQILLRGINVGGDSKVPPFRSVRGEKDFAPLRGWGFNSLRLLFNWEAFEPEPGAYDWDYLNYYRDMVDWAAQHDLYVIADIHQDAFSRYAVSGCGEGFPKWALPPFQTPAVPDNGANCKNWGVRMLFDIGMHSAWHHFYKNTYGVRDRYLSMLQHLAQSLEDAPNLIGFDLLNEPWGLEKSELPELYHDAGRLIQTILPDTVLFLSSHALTSTGIVPSSLDPISLPNIVHSAHFYDPGLQTFQTWSAWALKTANGHWKRMMEHWQSPLYLGEFGAPASLPNARAYVDAIYDLMDRELYSGAYWVYTPGWNATLKDGWNQEDFSINDDQGRLRGMYRARPYVEETPGNIVSMQWDENRKALALVYEATMQPEEIMIAIPSRLEWIGVETPDRVRNQPCTRLNLHQLRCINDQRPKQTLRSLIFLFRER
ncbi:glycoside hydrolase family 5 protein [Oligoflexus tunisiensis]|uniref:glycoside hydrolase family 5 protein n=1 Tax=Oligoflexus tunisiensis TaxID=708132 RepID=UPI000A7134AC|nr:cellulase family glycosylhydrolase [Oligoflexus tunisiensis]